MMVQFAPTANAVAQVPPADPAGRENGCGVPPPKVNEPPAKAELPVLVTVRVSALLVVPVAQFPKASGLGETLAERVAAVPVPLSETGELVTVAFPVMVTVPVAAPIVVGVNTTLIVHVAPAANVVPQVPPAVALAKGEVTATVKPVKVAPPLLLTVSGCDALVVPASSFPKANEAGVTLTTGNCGAVYSTAPMSIAVRAISGLGLPKKSELGAIE